MNPTICTLQVTEKLQALYREAETARHLRHAPTLRPLLSLRLGGWRVTLSAAPVPA